MTEVLTKQQIDEYHDVGGIVVENVLTGDDLAEIKSAIAQSLEEAQSMEQSNARIDLEDSHRPSDPRVRRIKWPHTQYPVFQRLMTSDAILGPARDLIGPNLRLHTSKLNMKSAGYGAAVEWHQDMAFYPHTNDDVLAIGVMIDDMEPQNGPLMIFPGSHRGETYDHHADGVFIGAVDLQANDLDPANAIMLTGPAGSVSIHHGRVLHGSALNTSQQDRRILFYEMMATDSFPIMGSMTRFETLEEYDDLILCGEPTIQPRISDWPVRIPQPQPDDYGSIYEIQKGLKKRGFSTYNSEENR